MLPLKQHAEIIGMDVVNISPEVKHWHGASKEGSFTHIAIEVPAENSSVEWLEKVEDNEYNKLD